MLSIEGYIKSNSPYYSISRHSIPYPYPYLYRLISVSRQTLPCIFFVDKPNMPQYHDRSDFIRRNTWRIYILITEEFVSSLSFASASFNYNIGNKRSCTTTTIRFEIVCTSLLLLVLRLPLFLIRFTNPSVSVVALIDQ